MLVRQGIPAHVVDLPKKAEDNCPVTELRRSCRWMHVLVGTGTGASTLHGQAVYGHSWRSEENGAFLDRVLEYMARSENSPKALGGDINYCMDGLGWVPPSVLVKLLTRCLVDADSELAAP